MVIPPCPTGKTGSYATLAAALEGLKDIRARSMREVKPQRAYPCQRCRAWHLTSQPKRTPTSTRRGRR